MELQKHTKNLAFIFLVVFAIVAVNVHLYSDDLKSLDLKFELPEATAQVPESTIRGETTEQTILSDDGFIKHGITKLGLPKHIENNEGEFVADIFNENGDGVQLESSSSTYYFDKSTCAMTEYAGGRIISGETDSIIKGNMWIVKVAQNGTDSWSDVSQNDLPCEVTTTVSDNKISINSTKADINGVISEIYDYHTYKGLKQTIHFTNNDPTLTDHKFSFSNILLDTPKSFRHAHVSVSNGTSVFNSTGYSIYEPIYQPNKLGDGVKLNSTAREIIEYDRDNLFVNGTAVAEGFTWYLQSDDMVSYTYDTAIDKLWAVKFLTQGDGTIDVYIDYANVNQPLGVGETTSIDPTTNFPSHDHLTINSFPTSFNGGSCGQGINNAFVDDKLGGRLGAAGNFAGSGCWFPILKFDISEIPDTASPISGTFSMNITSQGGSFGLSGYAKAILDENMFTLPASDIALGVVGLTEVETGHHFLPSAVSTLMYSSGCGGSLPCNMVDTKSALLDNFIIEFEEQLESGKDYYQLVICNLTNSCTQTVGGSALASTFTYALEGTFLEVEWIELAPAQPPTNEFVFYTPAPDECNLDWESPSDIGGAPAINGYQILRSSGGGDQLLVADTGGALPTDYVDGTILAGVGYTYKIAALTNQGVGLFTNSTNTCGVPTDPSAPFLQPAQNVALNQVALDWSPPVFTGNAQILGYKIERTTGTPQQVDNEWEWGIYNIGGLNAISVTQNSENVVWSNNPTQLVANKGSMVFFQTFDREEINGRTLSVVSRDFFMSPVTAFYFIEIRDGSYSTDGMNQGFGDFPSGGTIVSKGSGIVQTIFSGSRNTGASVFNDQAVVNTPTAVLDEVTVMIRATDSNTQTSRPSNMKLDSIDIEGVGSWDFGTVLPTKSVIINDVLTDDLALTPLGLGVIGRVDTQAGFTLGDGFITLVADTANQLLEFIDVTVDQLTNYGYRVSAINVISTGVPSNIVAILTAGVPDTPATPTVEATGTQTITISWTQPDLNQGALLGYELQRKLGTAGLFSTLESGLEVTTFDDGEGLFPLSSATEYCYRISVETTVGTSLNSFEACATTFDAPSEVENLTVIALDGSSVDMSFDDPLSDGGSELLGFKVERAIGAGAFITLDELTFVKFRNDTALPVGTEIFYRVSASNQFGFGLTDTASDTTDSTPQAPQNFTCSASSTTSLTLNWDTPITFSAPTGYQIDRRTVGGSFSTIVADTADTATIFLNDGLPSESIFEYRILAITAEGNTDFTNTIICSVLGKPDFPPEDLQGQFTSTVPHQMVLAWDIPDTFGIPINSFRVERDDGAGYNEIASVSSSSFVFIDNSPDNSVSQKYRVFTVGSEGDSPPTTAVPFIANQTSHWAYEKSIDDTGENKNAGVLTGNVNFNNTGINGLGHLFDGSTYITVDNEEDYDHDNNVSLGITTYYRGNTTGVTQSIITKSNTLGAVGYSMFVDSTGVLGVRLTNTVTSNELHVLGSTNVTDNSLHFLGFGYDGNNDESGLSLMVDGSFETKNIISNTLSNPILNNNDLTIGATDSGANTLTGLLDDTRFFGSGTLDDETLQAVAEESITTLIPINATVVLAGTVFADISSETPIIVMTSGYPLPDVNTLNLFNFTVTNVNSNTPLVTIDGVTGIFTLNDPSFFNVMSSQSNYTVGTSLTNSEETVNLLSNFDLQVPLFTFSGDFFFQQQRNTTFDFLSFNYTQTVIPFDLSCNFKSTLFDEGVTETFNDVFFVQTIQPVPRLEDVVVACIDPNDPPIDPTAPSFGGTNTILSFVSFGDTTGIGNFLQFTNNFGDFFGVGLPFLFVIILAAAFTGRSAPTGILIIGLALGIMWFLGILVIDPFMWGIILVLIILGVLGGKKFL